MVGPGVIHPIFRKGGRNPAAGQFIRHLRMHQHEHTFMQTVFQGRDLVIHLDLELLSLLIIKNSGRFLHERVLFVPQLTKLSGNDRSLPFRLRRRIPCNLELVLPVGFYVIHTFLCVNSDHPVPITQKGRRCEYFYHGDVGRIDVKIVGMQ
jgi:hypothetical protein